MALPSEKNRVTLKVIAERANVSIRTVSRVVNGRGEITEETRQRVQKIIDELGYRPNAVARSLVMGKSFLVGAIIPQITDPFFPEFINGVEARCKDSGHGVLLGNTDEDPEKELFLIQAMTDRQVDGLILCGTRLAEDELSHVARNHNVVFVTSQHPTDAPIIHIPGHDGMHRMTAYLAKLGHRSIVHLGFVREGDCERLNGYRRAIEESGIGFDPERVVSANRLTIDDGRSAMGKILDKHPDVTAVCCYNDVLAIGAILECHERGVEVPGRVSVTGFDDVALAQITQPSLTTAHVPRYRLGEIAASILLESDGERRLHRPPEINVELVIRNSTAPPA